MWSSPFRQIYVNYSVNTFIRDFIHAIDDHNRQDPGRPISYEKTDTSLIHLRANSIPTHVSINEGLAVIVANEMDYTAIPFEQFSIHRYIRDYARFAYPAL